ncbi:MAG: hypothetical protein ABFQ62_03110 [Patescibacteria group bacterium]
MLIQTLILSGIVLNSFGSIAYIVEVIKGRVKPNKVTFFLWSIAPFVAFFAQKSQEVGIQSLMTLSVGVFPLMILISSFLNKNAYWKILPFDLICGLLSLVGLALWYVTKIGNIAIIFSILADLLAALPTIRKSFYFPETEIGWPWFLSALSGFITFATTQIWKFEYYGFSLYYFLAMFVIFVLVQFKIGEKFKSNKSKEFIEK